MHARVTSSHGDPGTLDKVIAHVESTSVPAVRKMDGFKGILYLVDRTSGKGVAVTLWEDESALKASAAPAEKIRSEALAVGSGDVDSVAEYEVIIQEMV